MSRILYKNETREFQTKKILLMDLITSLHMLTMQIVEKMVK